VAVARGGATAAEDFFSGSLEGAEREREEEEEEATGGGNASTGNRSCRSCGTGRRTTAGRGRCEEPGAGTEGSATKEPQRGEARQEAARRGEGEPQGEEAEAEAEAAEVVVGRRPSVMYVSL
jgi:hypothetical protein